MKVKWFVFHFIKLPLSWHFLVWTQTTDVWFPCEKKSSSSWIQIVRCSESLIGNTPISVLEWCRYLFSCYTHGGDIPHWKEATSGHFLVSFQLNHGTICLFVVSLCLISTNPPPPRGVTLAVCVIHQLISISPIFTIMSDT